MAGVTVTLSLLSALGLGGEPEFQVPGPKARLEAIGDTTGLPETLRRALEPGPGFEPVPAPRPGDWLAEHPESGQTFDQFRRARKNVPDRQRATICLLPLGEFSAEAAPPLDTLREFAEAFFGMKVEVLDRVPLDGEAFTPRPGPFTGRRQLLTTDILRFLEGKLPKKGYCILGVTMEDLYPDPSWNFVFGQASIRDRTGVYSFVRYDPAFYGEPREKGCEKLVLRRSCRVLAHEAGHMFGLLHCIHFRCLMNGSNHLAESDAGPLHLCPVCLRKLQSSVRFDVADRYRKLLAFFRNVENAEEAAWIEGRLREVEGAEPAREKARPARGTAEPRRRTRTDGAPKPP